MNRDGQYYVPAWAVDALNDGDFYYVLDGQLFVKTLEGDMHISAGDYVIQGVKGEIYPCKPDIFEQTYERVEG